MLPQTSGIISRISHPRVRSFRGLSTGRLQLLCIAVVLFTLSHLIRCRSPSPLTFRLALVHLGLFLNTRRLFR